MGTRVGKAVSGRIVVSGLGFTVSCVRKLCGLLSILFFSKINLGRQLSYDVCTAGTAHT